MAQKIEFPGVALVTGAASGIGRATAVSFVKAGCTRIALVDLNEDGLSKTADLLKEAAGSSAELKIELCRCDITDPDSVVKAYAKAKQAFDRIDYAVNCAGIVVFGGPSSECSVEDFDRQNQVVYRGLWLCVRETLRIMKAQPLDSEAYPEANISPTRAQRGSIVNISSGLALQAQPGSSPYCGAKAGVMGLTRADAIDYVSHRIRINAVLPGVVDTPMTNPSPEIRKWMIEYPTAHTPMRRLAMPEEIADTCLFLTSNRASYITGTGVNVDGGFCAGTLY